MIDPPIQDLGITDLEYAALLTSSPTDSEYRIQLGIPKSHLLDLPVSQTLN